MKLKVDRRSHKLVEDCGILYLVLFQLEGKQLIKIGVTTRSIEERISEILVSMFKVYREFPYCRPKRFRQTANVFEKEAILHTYFKDYKYPPGKIFSGCTEFFDIPLDVAVTAYEQLLVNGAIACECPSINAKL